MIINNFKYQFIQAKNKTEFLAVCYFEWTKYNRIDVYLSYCSEKKIEPSQDYISWITKNFPTSKKLLIRIMLLTSDGKQKLANSMAQPLRTRTDYESVARRAFVVEPLPEGALPVYDSEGNYVPR